MSDSLLRDEKTPEDRLREYKKRIAQMAKEDGKQTKEAVESRQEVNDAIGEDQTEKAGPPRNLQSPAKQELRSSLGVRKLSPVRNGLTGTDSPHKTRLMLRARELAIEASLQDIKSRKERLELLFERKLITLDEFEKRKQEIVREGQDLLREKAEVDKKLSK